MRRRSHIAYCKLLTAAACLVLSLGLSGQSELANKIFDLTKGCFDLDSYIYLPDRDLCVGIFNIEGIEIAENDILNIECYGNYVYTSTVSELLGIDTSICNEFPVYYLDRMEISRRRDKVKYEAHAEKYDIPTYNCRENFKYPCNEVDILGFHTYQDSTLYYIEEDSLFKITKRQDGSVIDLYNYKIEDDVLLGQLVKSYHSGITLKENKELRPDSIDIEVCWLNNDCILNHFSYLLTAIAWNRYEVNDETKWKSVFSEIKRKESRRLRE